MSGSLLRRIPKGGRKHRTFGPFDFGSLQSSFHSFFGGNPKLHRYSNLPMKKCKVFPMCFPMVCPMVLPQVCSASSGGCPQTRPAAAAAPKASSAKLLDSFEVVLGRGDMLQDVNDVDDVNSIG